MGRAKPGVGSRFRGLDLHHINTKNVTRHTRTVPNMLGQGSGVESPKATLKGTQLERVTSVRLQDDDAKLHTARKTIKWLQQNGCHQPRQGTSFASEHTDLALTELGHHSSVLSQPPQTPPASHQGHA
ncbi:hypothetical protein PoB_003239600 [Plakobranchus ocellatus]|uniref:Uncharacterized protein n=1 Tax=Plakobranchus ocellatus TaxID=259542 RepID=A0AAV4A3Q6_9GAST|nr:hypothetical protein PoB_003239600 [Plakobranchus ocellatus]